MAFLLSGGSVFVCGLSLPCFGALVRWLWGRSFLLARALLAPRGGCGRFLPLCRRARAWFLSFGLVVRLAPVSFGFVAVRRGLAFPFLLAWSAAAKRAVPSSLGWVCTPPLGGAGFAGAAAGAARLLRRAVRFFGARGFLRGARVPLGFRFPLAGLAGWRFFLLGRRARAWFLSFGLVGVAALGGRKAPPPRPPPPPLRSRVVGCWRPPLFLAVWGGACWVLGLFLGRWGGAGGLMVSSRHESSSAPVSSFHLQRRAAFPRLVSLLVVPAAPVLARALLSPAGALLAFRCGRLFPAVSGARLADRRKYEAVPAMNATFKIQLLQKRP